ncbi:MAG: hypothetical protein A3H98_05340 [Bacteroidetes bacterium RIFCSPLOWO2_02_FULL_36_8]|nr:MAG: hypothetical protein A3H98_05340 [Bacteroidetes bacterium RIFCSPLOWO2_02_FULL_36_8]OFY70311.1 MAG: hypothetical protein A3G23_09250 [Bacteroidetes bacterium RIFCSPLOWO2_12_FULL_37_12]
MLLEKLTYRGLFIHFIIFLLLNVAVILYFFYSYLPSTTLHNQEINVPDVKGMNMADASSFLEKQQLRIIISDSSYNSTYPALVVLDQVPKPGLTVKQNRSIYLTINSKYPPLVKAPDLVDGSVRSAQIILESYGLRIGNVSYVPDIAQNAVLEQQFRGRVIEPGKMIPRGSKIDLIIGNGLGEELIVVPSLVGYHIQEAEELLIGMGLNVGTLLYDSASTEPAGVILKQKPDTLDQRKIHAGEMIDFLLSGIDPDEKKEKEKALMEAKKLMDEREKKFHYSQKKKQNKIKQSKKR